MKQSALVMVLIYPVFLKYWLCSEWITNFLLTE